MTSRHFPTDSLIDSLVSDLRPLPRGAVPLRLTAGAFGGAAFALVMLLLLIGVRPDIVAAAGTPAFWAKAAYTIAVAAVALVAAARLARPDARTNHLWLLPLPLFFYLPVALVEIARAKASDPLLLLLGHGWQECTPLILVLSLPVFGGLLWAFKRFAPTRPRLAGAVAGLCSSSVAAVVYGLHCQSSAAPFVVTWYTLAFVIASIAGALLGGRLLRW